MHRVRSSFERIRPRLDGALVALSVGPGQRRNRRRPPPRRPRQSPPLPDVHARSPVLVAERDARGFAGRQPDDASHLVAASSVPEASGSPAAGTGELTVFGAASLKGAFDVVDARRTPLRSGLTPVYSFDASSALRTQIEQGAPADVFASADTSNVQTLVGEGLANDAVVFACNQLTIIVPADNPAGHHVRRRPGQAGRQGDRGRPGSADHQVRRRSWSRTWASPTRTPQTWSARKTTSRRCEPRSRPAKATPRSST